MLSLTHTHTQTQKDTHKHTHKSLPNSVTEQLPSLEEKVGTSMVINAFNQNIQEAETSGAL